MNYALQILFILILMLIGFIVRKRGMISAVGTSEMVRVLIAVIYPCLIFSSVTKLDARELAANWIMPVMALAIAGTGLLLGLLALKFLKGIDRQRASAFLFQNTINNYLFLPLPLVMLAWGEKGVALLVFASMGFELTVWTVGVFLFNRSSKLSEGIRMMFGPPLIVLIFSICWVCVRDLLHPEIPNVGIASDLVLRILELADFGAETIGRAAVAVSMVVSGSRIAALDVKAAFDGHVWLLSALRLIATPILFILVLKMIPMEETAYGILCVIATMPAAVTSLIFSERFGGDSDFIASTLLVTHIAGVITIPLLLAWAI
ncbi:AEC family transporter [Pontiella agarivorans]|uniref:AEC family transporter n=1 Tax=Pontiella agarivorans TaxID=3038953 RepID=A0ABU5MVS3_9BACT|nr:AEC family transporter [Pontiella agarivorans]MDZ8118300.1 AEC family transporter [Pontiella agarivorans]